ncbi:MAG TPA: VWA domain-containing protein [Thermoanaerobaculia bacterium]|nr:VWA domain-containing protein [Thermoanaerobaculia bacterium]
MGYGNYSHQAHRDLLRGRAALPQQAVFQQRECHPLMNPKGVKVRESRDSDDHPHSLGIVFALDVTGSMGQIPHLLATQQLPHFMKVLTDCEIPDPQLLFTAIGDAVSDRAPLQVGQFESTAELMDQWLTWCYIESGGGGSGEESYELALYFLALHTEMDCMVKRGKRGYLFITGDERPYPMLSRHVVEAFVGDHLDDDVKVEEVIAEVQKSFVPFFVIPDPQRRTSNGAERAWRDLLGDHVLCLDGPEDVCYATAGAILVHEGRATEPKQLAETLLEAGMPAERQGAVLRTLRPLIEARRR